MIGAALAAFLVPASAAEPECHPLKEMLAALVAQYQELPVSVGMVGNHESMIVLTVSAHGATFSLLSVMPGATPDIEATACLIASGTNWAVVTPPRASTPDARPARPAHPRRPMVKPADPDEAI